MAPRWSPGRRSGLRHWPRAPRQRRSPVTGISPWVRRRASQACLKGAVAQHPRRLPALHPLIGGRRKLGKDAPRVSNNRGGGALADCSAGCLKTESGNCARPCGIIPPRFRGGWPSGGDSPARSGGVWVSSQALTPPRASRGPSPKTGRDGCGAVRRIKSRRRVANASCAASRSPTARHSFRSSDFPKGCSRSTA